MLHNTTPLLIGSLMLLAACGQEPGKAPTASAPAASVSASAPASDATATASAASGAAEPAAVTSKDGKVSFTPNGSFQDKLGDAAFMPNVPADKVVLLQYSEDKNLTLTVTETGKANNAKDYFAKLSAALKKDGSITSVAADTPTDTQISYHFTHKIADKEAATESCTTTISSDKTIITACAAAPNASAEDLKAVLGSLKIN